MEEEGKSTSTPQEVKLLAEGQENQGHVGSGEPEPDESSAPKELAKPKAVDGRNFNELLDMMVPAEVRKLVFQRLDNESKQNARQVCKKWNDMIEPLLQWNIILYDYEAEDIHEFAKKGHHLNFLSVSKLQEYKYPEEGFGFEDVRRLEFLPFAERVVKGRDAEFSGISDFNLKSLIKDLKDMIRVVRLHSRSFNDIDLATNPFRHNLFFKLEELLISTWNKDGPGYYICLDALENTFPALKKLNLSLFFDADNEEDEHGFNLSPPHPQYYREVYQFLIRHKDTLQDVHLDYGSSDNDINNPDPVLLSLDHTIPRDVFLRMVEDLKSVDKLSSITMALTPYESRNRFIFGMTLLTAQTHLTQLKISNFSRWNKLIWLPVQVVIIKCRNTLQQIHCKGCFCPGPDPAERDAFSCGVMKLCKQLTDLQISICGMKIDDIDQLPKNIKILDLGMEMTSEKIDYIKENFPALKEWYLLQSAAKGNNTQIPKISNVIFKSILDSMLKLEKLMLVKQFCEWKVIKKVIRETPGLRTLPFDKEARNPDCVDVGIDRLIYNKA